MPALAMAGGIALIGVFVHRQARLADPLIDLRLFRLPAFGASLAINIVGFFFMFGSFVFIAQYFQLVAGMTPLEAGLWSVPSAAAFTAASFLTPALAGRMRPAALMAAGMAMSAAGLVMLALASGPIGVVAASIVFSVGFTPVVSLTTGLIVGAAPPERAGIASGLSETSTELGGALGIAVLGSLIAALYRAGMVGAGLDGLPPDIAQTARTTLGGAVDAAALLPPGAASDLLSVARGAFMDGFGAMALLGAGALLGAALLTLAVLRGVRPNMGAHG
jgi:DHA2 family multidrug resistance protein-like MFS transporter